MAFHKMRSEESGIVLLSYATKKNALERIVSLEHTRLSTETLHMSHIRKTTQSMHLQFIKSDGLCLGVKEALVVHDLDMPSETDDLATYLILETNDDAHRQDHHGQTDCDTPDGDAHGWARQTVAFVTLAKQSAGYGELKGQERLMNDD